MQRRPSVQVPFRRSAALVTVILMLGAAVAACGSDSEPTATPKASADKPSASATTAPPGGYPAVDQPGVSDTEIRVSGVTSTSNPLGGLYGTAFDGVQAYFDMINDQGGVYGRELVMVKEHDDQLTQNQREVAAIVNQDDVFAVLPVATIFSFSGAQILAREGIPTFGWGINEEWTGPPNLYGHLGALCNGSECPGIGVPWLAHKLKKHRLAVLSYNVANSADCLDGIKASFKKYGKSAKAKIVYETKALSFGVTDLSSDVQKMVDADVDFVTTCMDSNGVLTLAREMRQQGLDAIQYLPNGYDHDFMEKNGGFFEGSYVLTQIAPLETKPRFPALKRYVAQMKKADKRMTENAEIGWINADHFVTGLKAAGPDFTREKVVTALNQDENWDAQGLLAPIDWTAQHTDLHYPRTCGAYMVIEDSEFVPKFGKPGKPFICWQDSDSTRSVTEIKPTARQ